MREVFGKLWIFLWIGEGIEMGIELLKKRIRHDIRTFQIDEVFQDDISYSVDELASRTKTIFNTKIEEIKKEKNALWDEFKIVFVNGYWDQCDEFKIIGFRDETDQEYQKRVERNSKNRDFEKQRKQKKREKKLKQFQELAKELNIDIKPKARTF